MIIIIQQRKSNKNLSFSKYVEKYDDNKSIIGKRERERKRD